ncbi:hypothetical protein G6F55_014463 [Rhizopus delemar]|nr:hypothetical protein G6F55_014463 [Rhizopus delemar]
MWLWAATPPAAAASASGVGRQARGACKGAQHLIAAQAADRRQVGQRQRGGRGVVAQGAGVAYRGRDRAGGRLRRIGAVRGGHDA